jgi:monoamine oxidase
MDYDVIVVGAGLSGLSSALLLSDNDICVMTLEANDRVGGRTHTIQDSKCGSHVDVGGAYFGAGQRRIIQLAQRFNLKFRKGHRDVYSYYGDLIPRPSLLFHPVSAIDISRLLRRLDSMTAAIPVDAPWSADCALAWDTITLKEFLDKNCWTKHAHRMITVICRIILCTEPHEISLLSFLWIMACGGGVRNLAGAFTTPNETKFVDGMQKLAESLAEAQSGHVRKSSPVVCIEQSTSNVVVSKHAYCFIIFTQRVT